MSDYYKNSEQKKLALRIGHIVYVQKIFIEFGTRGAIVYTVNGRTKKSVINRELIIMLSKSELFKLAHTNAKQYRDYFDSYKFAFSFALTELYAAEKAQTQKEIDMSEQQKRRTKNAW